MIKHNCPNCAFRSIYDRKPRSFLGQVWRWHANWCPGWNGYLRSLGPDARRRLALKYQMKKYL